LLFAKRSNFARDEEEICGRNFLLELSDVTPMTHAENIVHEPMTS